jgi:hypothetical protein
MRDPTPGELKTIAEQHLRILEHGDALIVRVPADWSFWLVKDLHEALNVLAAEISLNSRVIVIPADEIETCTWQGGPPD